MVAARSACKVAARNMGAALKKFLIVVTMLIASAAEAGTKSEILGFYPGMSPSALDARRAGLECKADTCRVNDGIIQFRRKPDKTVEQVALQFTSKLKPRDQIAATAKEFGVTTRKSDIGDIGHAMGRYETLPLMGATLMTGGQICRWRLPNGATLALKLDTTGETFTYILYLAKS